MANGEHTIIGTPKYTNGNGNGNVRTKIVAETFALGLAEVASMVVSVGAFTFAGEVAPGITDKVTHVVAKHCIEPFLDTIEAGLQKCCKLKECQPDYSQPREKRAEHYAKYLTLFGVSLTAGLATEIGVRMALNRAFKVEKHDASRGWKPTRHDLKVVAWDKIPQLIAIGAINTVGAEQTDIAIDATSNLFQKVLGWPKDRATRASEMLIAWHVPDFVGLLFATGHIAAYRTAEAKNAASHLTKSL